METSKWSIIPVPERQEISRPEGKEVHPRIGIGEYPLIAKPQVDGESRKNVADGNAGGRAGNLLVDGVAVGVGDLVAVRIGLYDIRAAESIAYVRFDVESGSGAVESVAETRQYGGKGDIIVAIAEIIKTTFRGNGIAIRYFNAEVEEAAKTDAGKVLGR